MNTLGRAYNCRLPMYLTLYFRGSAFVSNWNLDSRAISSVCFPSPVTASILSASISALSMVYGAQLVTMCWLQLFVEPLPRTSSHLRAQYTRAGIGLVLQRHTSEIRPGWGLWPKALCCNWKLGGFCLILLGNVASSVLMPFLVCSCQQISVWGCAGTHECY